MNTAAEPTPPRIPKAWDCKYDCDFPSRPASADSAIEDRWVSRRRVALTWGIAALPIITALCIPRLAAFKHVSILNWTWMWLLVGASFASAKWITVADLILDRSHFKVKRLLGYVFLWPGLNARRFLGKGLAPKPSLREWRAASLKTLTGATLLIVAAHLLGAARPFALGWLGMAGLVIFLHFGLSHLLSLLWRTAGINAEPIMRSPITATSLSQFWGGAWNAAFRDVMHDHVFNPLSRKRGGRYAVLSVFLISGLLHEMVITIPAHGGYGFPTAYFLVQCLGIFIEHGKLGRRLGLGRGASGWCFAMLVTALPAYWLFPPIFVRNVIVPMLGTLRTLFNL
jgi:Membrane bound O-acyl transferase family